MRIQQCVRGLNNSQRIRVIVDGVGFYTTVQGAMLICTNKHRIAVDYALHQIAKEKKNITGFGSNINGVDVQVDLMD